jgi:hypothetical protein
LLTSIQASGNGLTLTELLCGEPGIARRTAQRLFAKLIESGHTRGKVGLRPLLVLDEWLNCMQAQSVQRECSIHAVLRCSSRAKLRRHVVNLGRAAITR